MEAAAGTGRFHADVTKRALMISIMITEKQSYH